MLNLRVQRDPEEGGELDSHEELDNHLESRRDQEEGGELDSLEELDYHLRVQARSRGGR